MAKAKTLAAPSGKVKPPAKGSETRALLERAARGDQGCQGQLDALLDDPEPGPRVIELYANIPLHALWGIVKRAAGEDLAVKGAICRRMGDLQAELAGPTPSPIERLLAERAAFCWLVLWRYEEILVNAKDLTIKQAEYHQRRIDSAHRRFCSSLRTLAAVRKLALPSLQVNIGRNQLNVGGIAGHAEGNSGVLP